LIWLYPHLPIRRKLDTTGAKTRASVSALGTLISLNGRIGGEADTRISVLDRGFLFGDSVYEVTRTYRGRPWALDEHLDRLQRSALLLGIELPVTLEQLAQEVLEILRTAREGGNAGEFYLRLIVTRGTGPITLDPRVAEHPNRVIIALPLVPLPASLYREGVAIRLVHTGQVAQGELPRGAKSGNYLTNIMALKQARESGAHEAVMIDPHGRVSEGSSSNVFMVTSGKVLTPPLSVGILEGITRRRVIALALAQGLDVREVEIGADRLAQADEVFLTSTLREVLPVTRVDQRPVGDGRPGPTTTVLSRAFARMVAEDRS
jgi:branched-chain amino acid aminotransferase